MEIIKKKLCISFLFLTPSVCVCQHVFVHVHIVPKGPEKGTDPLELDFQTAMSCPIWVLGKELRNSVSPDALNLNPQTTLLMSQAIVCGTF